MVQKPLVNTNEHELTSKPFLFYMFYYYEFVCVSGSSQFFGASSK